jgi:hypothetical protein
VKEFAVSLPRIQKAAMLYRLLEDFGSCDGLNGAVTRVNVVERASFTFMPVPTEFLCCCLCTPKVRRTT